MELDVYFAKLGWDIASWNAAYGDPPVSRLGDWDSLTGEQQQAANQLCFFKSSYDRLDMTLYGLGTPMMKPVDRFVPWHTIEEDLQSKLSKTFEYTDLSWNVLRLAEIEQKGWFQLVYYQEELAKELGFDQEWDCWINHFDSYSWNDIVSRKIGEHFTALGWTEKAWDGDEGPPESDSKSWSELSEVEQLHASQLCYDFDAWERIDMTPNDGPYPYPLPEIRFTPWKELNEDQRRVARAVFLYDETMWDNFGMADIESRAWDDLTDYQRPYAIELGLYERTWNCFQNHFRASEWTTLSIEQMGAFETLGWDEGMWTRRQEEPSLYERGWAELTPEEKSAAEDVCFTEVSWPSGSMLSASATQSSDGGPATDNSSTGLKMHATVLLGGATVLMHII